MPDYFVYILTNRSKTLYVGATNDLHEAKLLAVFSPCHPERSLSF